MKFLDKKLSRFCQYAAKTVVLLTLVAIVVPFSLLAPTPAYAQTAPKADTPSDALECSLSSPSVCLANVVYVFTVGIGSGLAYVSAFMLDTTISLSLNSSAYALSFLSSGWTTARDLANMAFILILVYIAFMIMFQAETAGTIRMLAWVIFIALIINFSFFFTRVVIDAGNILAVQFYNSIGVGPNGQTVTMAQTFAATNSGTGTLANAATGAATAVMPNGTLQNTKDLTASIMNALNIQQLFSNESFKSFAGQSGFGAMFITLSFLYLAMGACYFILAAMFLAVSVKFIVRIVVLWFLIIASPLAFICKAVPNNSQISGWYDKWQHELVSHAFYPAFFLFIFFFISTIMSGLNGSGGILGDLAKNLNGLASNPNLGSGTFVASLIATIAIRLGFVIATLYIALKASEYMGVKGAEIAHRVTSFTFGQTGRIAALSGRVVGQNTLGRAGTALVNSNYLSTRAENAPPLLKKTLKGIERGSKPVGNALGKASYDARNAPGAGLLKKGIEKISGSPVNAGAPTAGNFMAQAKERDDRRKAEEKEEKKKGREEELKETVKGLAESIKTRDETEQKIKAGTATPADIDEHNRAHGDVDRHAKKINNLSKPELELFSSKDVAGILKEVNEGTIKKVEESDRHSNKEKEEMRNRWEEESRHSALNKSHNIISELRSINTDLKKAGITLTNMDAHIGTAGAPIVGATMTAAKIASAKSQVDSHMATVKDQISDLDREIGGLSGELNKPGLSKTETDRLTDLQKTAKENRVIARNLEAGLNRAIKHLDNLEAQRSKVPAETGGEPRAGEFKTKV